MAKAARKAPAKAVRTKERFAGSVQKLLDRFDAARKLFRIPPKVSAVAWIQENIELPKESSAEGGTKFKMYGFQKGAVDIMVDPAYPEVGVMKATRTGFTQTVTSVAAYYVAYEGTLVGLWQPIEDKAREYASTYWTPLFKRSKGTKHLIRRIRKGDTADTWNERTYANGAKIYISSAQSDDNFRSRTIRVTMGDEVDAEGWKAGGPKSQGNKFKLMWERSRNFWNRKQILWSSPLDRKTSNIWPLWQASQKFRYFVACPHCEERQYLEWGGAKEPYGLKWKVDEEAKVVDAWYVCKVNGCIIQEEEKYGMDEWAYEAPAHLNLGWRPTDRAKRPGLAVLHVNALMSLFDGANWKSLAQEWLDAQGKPEDLKTFINNVLGEPTDDTISRSVTVTGLSERAEAYPAEVPDEVIALTLSGDAQTGSIDQTKETARAARVEVSVWGWGRFGEAWLVGHFVLDQFAPFSPECRTALKAIIKRPWRKKNGKVLHSAAAFFDAGDGNMINEVVDFCSDPELARWNVHPIRGAPETTGKRRPVLGERDGLTKDGRKFLWIGTQGVKDSLDRMLRTTEPGPGYVHFPLSMAENPLLSRYFQDIMAEAPKKDPRTGLYHWVRKSQAFTGEAWDCFVYAYAALEWVKRKYPRIALEMLRPRPEGAPPILRWDGRDLSAMSDLSQELGIISRPGEEAEVRRPIMPARAAPVPAPAPKPKRPPMIIRPRWS